MNKHDITKLRERERERESSKNSIIQDLQDKVNLGVLEQENFKLLKKLIDNASNLTEALQIAQMGICYDKTGLKYQVKLDKINDNKIHYLKRDDDLSFDQGGIQHKLIIGDNYHALKNLLITHRGKIDVIYIDPPYGCDNMGEFAKTNYVNNITRDNLLSMLEPRIRLAKELLSDTGVIFCSIDDKNHAFLKILFDEVFGENNFLESFVAVKNSGSNSSSTTKTNHEYALMYAKKMDEAFYSIFQKPKQGINEVREFINKLKKEGLNIEKAQQELSKFYRSRPEWKGITLYKYLEKNTWRLFQSLPITAPGSKNFYDILHPITGRKVSTSTTGWRWNLSTFQKKLKENKIIFGSDEKQVPRQKLYLDDVETDIKNSTFFYDQADGQRELVKIFGKNNEYIFSNPKAVSLIKYLIWGCSSEAIVLDFFAGSGTTGQAVLGLNSDDGGQRQFILCNIDENDIPEKVTYERLKRVMTGNPKTKWLSDNGYRPYGDSLNVYKINYVEINNKEAFEKIDPKDYDIKNLKSVKDRAEWICDNFEELTYSLKGKND